jgi:hypothetical protein
MAQTAPPQVGVPVTKDSLNAKLGALANNQRKTATGYQELIDFLAPYAAADLETLWGFTADEANLYLSCVRAPTEAPAFIAMNDACQFLPRVGGV